MQRSRLAAESTLERWRPSCARRSKEESCMNNTAREKLREILAQQGTAVVEDPKRLRALLSDQCPALKREIHVLAAAAELRVAAELNNASSVSPWATASGRLTRK